MTYADAARAVLDYIGSTASPTVPLNVLLIARAGEALAPISASQDGRSFGIGARRLVSTADFYELARLPGVQFQQLTAEAPASFVVDATDPPRVLLTEFQSSDLGDLVGPNNLAVLRAMREAWNVRIRGTGFYSGDQVDLAVAIIDGGVMCFPVAARSLKSRYPNLPSDLLAPATISGDENQARYDKLCALFHDVLLQYDHKNLATAAAAVEAANRNADLWAELERIAIEVRDAPSNAVVGAGKLVGGALWDTLAGNWPLVLIVGAGVALYLFRGKLGGIAKAGFKASGAAV